MRTMWVFALVALNSLAGNPAAAAPALQGGSAGTTSGPSNDAVFDRSKGAIYALYARALRDQPKLSGKIVFEIDIDAAGVATACRVKSSQLKAPDFERKLCERIQRIRFSPQPPNTWTRDLTLISAA